MPLPIESILGIDQLTGIVTNPKGGVPMPNLPSEFLTTKGPPVDGMTSYYDRVTNVRNTAQLTDPNAPAKPGETPNAGRIPVTLMHSREYILHGPELLMKLVAPGSQMAQDRAIQEIGRKSVEFARRFDNLRIATICSALATGKIYFTGKGKLLPSSSSASITVDFQVPTNNLNNTGIGAWNITSTDLLAQIEAEKLRLNQLTGLNYTNILYGKNIPGYLALNTAFASFINSSPVLAQSFASNTIPASFASPGMKWWNGSSLWYEDSDGTNQSWIGANQIVMFPDVTSDWYEIQEGGYIIPEDLGAVYGSSEQAVNGFVSVTGRFAYATKSSNPPGVQHFIGDTFLPVVKVPGALRICTNVTSAAS